MTTKYPLISCLTVSTNRITLLKRAIDCYLAQTYPNKELVIVTSGEPRYDAAVQRYLKKIARDDIRLCPAALNEWKLSDLRNLTLSQARGEMICQWDDDDLYHPERLRVQFDAMNNAGADACFLTDFLHFNTRSRRMYWVDWSPFKSLGKEKSMLPGSMLALRDESIRYPDGIGHGEDNQVREHIAARHTVCALAAHGYLYVYVFHGRNVYPENHHHALSSMGFDSDYIISRAAKLSAALAAYPLPMPYAIVDATGSTVFEYFGPTHESHQWSPDQPNEKRIQTRAYS